MAKKSKSAPSKSIATKALFWDDGIVAIRTNKNKVYVLTLAELELFRRKDLEAKGYKATLDSAFETAAKAGELAQSAIFRVEIRGDAGVPEDGGGND